MLIHFQQVCTALTPKDPRAGSAGIAFLYIFLVGEALLYWKYDESSNVNTVSCSLFLCLDTNTVPIPRRSFIVQ